MKIYTLKEHFLELKYILLKILAAFVVCFCVCYYYSEHIYTILLQPLITSSSASQDIRRIIFTGLTEAFLTYIKLAAFSAFVVIFPFITWQIYSFIAPGLYRLERRIAAFILFAAPLLFWLGGGFVFYYVMPKAWHFFISFEKNNALISIVLEARISEYLGLVIQLIIAFGLAFQLPVIILIMHLLKLSTVESLKKKRRLAIVINFTIAGILTPPDVISQLALAIPLLLLYEISIIICKLVDNKEENAGHKVD